MKTEIRLRNKPIQRVCIASGIKYMAKDMLRINYDKKNSIISIDWNQNLSNRGAYFYPSKENWNKIKKTRALNRTFKSAINNEIYQNFELELEEKLWQKTPE